MTHSQSVYHLHALMSETQKTPPDVFLKVVDLLMYEHFALAQASPVVVSPKSTDAPLPVCRGRCGRY